MSHLYSVVKTIKRNNRAQNKITVPFSKLKFYTAGPHSMVIKIHNETPMHLKTVQKHFEVN